MEFGASNFVCVACERDVDRRWWNSSNRNRSLPPICFGCERRYTEGTGKPKYGSFMDRRNAMRIAALAECLQATAAAKKWSAKYVSA
jgi:hypothetical protein